MSSYVKNDKKRPCILSRVHNIYTEMLLWMVIPTVVPFIFVKAVPGLDCVAAVPYQFIKLGYITGYN